MTQGEAMTVKTTTAPVSFRLEVVTVPVSDPDRARDFFVGLGWRLDIEVKVEGYHVVHLTPPGSNTSVAFGTGITAATPGSSDGLLLAVDDIDGAREHLIARGVDVSEPFHDVSGSLGGGFHVGEEGRAYGHDPERRSYGTYASFQDTEGNRWILQELTDRLPGRVWDGEVSVGEVAAFAQLVHETAEHHDSFEKESAPHDWWDWYGPYLYARMRGAGIDEATKLADGYMAGTRGVERDK
jgi:catechol 2,3-dioxygenase-like lactoylglutathione lyase family enzyme